MTHEDISFELIHQKVEPYLIFFLGMSGSAALDVFTKAVQSLQHAFVWFYWQPVSPAGHSGCF